MKLSQLKEEKTPNLMIIPMIDVMFFLLVFFMINMLTMVEQNAMPVQVPKAAQTEKISETNITITIDENGGITWDKDKMTLAEMQNRLLMNGRNKQAHFLIQADQNITYQKVVDILDFLKKNGAQHISLAVEKV